jgi:SAM-dependent methyltransferase
VHDEGDDVAAAPGLVWSGTTGAAWLANAEGLERQLEPVNEPLFGAAALQPGETVVDVGCGRGVTSRRAAAAVGARGHVVAVDIAPDLLDAARAYSLPPGAARVEWVLADAQRHPFARDRADIVMSRFGVMFFEDAVAAFANLRTAVRSGGRLAIAVWQPRDVSPLHARVLGVVRDAAARHGVEMPDHAPDGGPYSFGVDAYVHGVLEAAGWSDVAFVPHTLALYLGGAGTSPADAAKLRLAVGPLEVQLRGAPAAARAAIADALRADLETCWDGTGVRLDAGIVIVTARRA